MTKDKILRVIAEMAEANDGIARQRRFKDRLVRGEWYNPTPVDVKAFKKWRRIS
jgi:hypothetical protein